MIGPDRLTPGLLLSGLAALPILAYLFFDALAFYSAAPNIATHGDDVSRMLALARPKPGELWLDLGSGDGRVVIAAAGAGARAVGCELNPLLVLVARTRIRFLGLGERAQVRWASLWGFDVAGADVVSMYLMPRAMRRLRPKIEAQAKPGCRIVSNQFALPGWEAAAQDGWVFLYVNRPEAQETR